MISASDAMAVRLHHRSAPPPTAVDHVEAWVDAGLITQDEALAIRQYEHPSGEPRTSSVVGAAPSGPSLVVEALGYLGGVVTLVGAMILVSVFWHDISTARRLVLVGAAALALLSAGFAVPDRLEAAALRLRAVLWAAAVVATGGFAALLSVEVLDRTEYHALVVIGPPTAALAGLLWLVRPTWLQQLAFFVPLMLTADGIGLDITSGTSWLGGALMWGLGTVFAALALARTLPPQTTGVAFGLVGAVLGAMIIDNDLGIGLALLTAVATVTLSLWKRSLPWLGVGALSLLGTAPRAANEWFPGRMSAAVTLIVTGCLLVTSAIWVARRRGTG